MNTHLCPACGWDFNADEDLTIALKVGSDGHCGCCDEDEEEGDMLDQGHFEWQEGDW